MIAVSHSLDPKAGEHRTPRLLHDPLELVTLRAADRCGRGQVGLLGNVVAVGLVHRSLAPGTAAPPAPTGP